MGNAVMVCSSRRCYVSDFVRQGELLESEEYAMTEHLNYMERNWWVLLVRGISAIVFGLCAFVWPGLTAATLVLLFGVYMLMDGLFAVAESVRYQNQLTHWWVWLLDGLLSVLVGVLVLFMPGATALALLILIGVWAIIGGALRVVAAIQIRKEVEGEWLLALGGALSILFGIVVIMQPVAGLISLVWLIGSWGLVLGVVFIMLAFRLRKASALRRG